MADVYTTLVDIHVRARGTEEGRGPIKRSVARRYELQQALGCRTARGLNLSSLGVGQNIARGRQPLTLPESLVTREEKRLLLENGSANISSELIALQSGLRDRRGVEEISGVEVVVAQVVVSFAVELIGARSRGDVHDRAGIPAKLRAVRGVVDLVRSSELMDRWPALTTPGGSQLCKKLK